ncbi:MAG TPA: hypothetical protein G4N92_04845 [Anaerolineae bacterium]|nr:hypothetical protein [Anaerolineae bacterium]
MKINIFQRLWLLPFKLHGWLYAASQWQFRWYLKSIHLDEQIINSLNKYSQGLSEKEINEVTKQKKEIPELVKPISPILPIPEKEEGEVYGIDSTFLAKCWRWLVQNNHQSLPTDKKRFGHSILNQDPEWACLVTGMHINGVRMLADALRVQFSSQSAGGLQFELGDFQQSLRSLQRWGYSLHAVFHSHRFNGPVSPSQIDLNTQRQLLEPVFPAIQAVFSEDGYIRFFSAERPFSIKIFGKGVKHVEDTLYQLDQNLRSAAEEDDIWPSLVFPRRSD